MAVEKKVRNNIRRGIGELTHNGRNELDVMTFDNLVEAIRLVHREISLQTKRAVNLGLTVRNWTIGYYIREYEQRGSDRARYGARVCEKLALQLQGGLDRCYSDRYLRLCRQFYDTYPQIGKSVISESNLPIWKSVISELKEKAGSANIDVSRLPSDLLIGRLSFTHLIELMVIEDELKRTFYEVECVRGNWSVRELRRQIGSLYYERSGLSGNKEKLAELVQTGVEKDAPALAIRDPYVFEFLGLRPEEVLPESDLENELITKLQEFLLELGTGFCFEARQKRILIGNTYGFIDLVFYHRILKCYVLVELKRSRFAHEDIGQLNTYVSWYKKNVAADADNPPVGILLCTEKDHALVEYALAGMSNQLFVSKYQLVLPGREDIRRFIEEHALAVGEEECSPATVLRKKESKTEGNKRRKKT